MVHAKNPYKTLIVVSKKCAKGEQRLFNASKTKEKSMNLNPPQGHSHQPRPIPLGIQLTMSSHPLTCENRSLERRHTQMRDPLESPRNQYRPMQCPPSRCIRSGPSQKPLKPWGIQMRANINSCDKELKLQLVVHSAQLRPTQHQNAFSKCQYSRIVTIYV